MTRARPPLVPAFLLHAALLAVLAAIPAAAFPVSRSTLPNGLRVVLAPDSLATAVDAALWLPAGSRHERQGQAGLAALAARLGFRNGADLPLAPLAATGGTGSVVATPDYTSLSATVPAGELDAALGFLAERLPGRPVTATALAAERNALRAEAGRGDRTPVARGLSLLWSAAWPGHPYATTGTPPGAGSETLKPADVDAWRRTRWAPAGAVLTLAGAFDPDTALAQVRARFGKLARGSAPSGGTQAAPKATRRLTERMDVPARVCLVGWRAPGSQDPDALPLEVLASWLGGGSNSRLSTTLVRDWQLAVTAQAGLATQKDGSLLWTLAVVPPGVDSVALERTLLDAVQTAIQRELESFELERARRQLGATAGFALQAARPRGQALGEAEVLSGGAEKAALWDALARVSAADVRRAATRVLTESGRATVWLVPSSKEGAR